MIRREFLTLISAGMCATRASGETPASEALPRAHWLEDGMIDAGGSHEPYLFVVRRGGQSLDARQSYESAQSGDVIRALRQQGVEVFHTHLYKGFGMAAEMPEMRDAVRSAALAHSLGMKVDSYIQWNTLMYETFFAEEPRAKNWVQRDVLGRPILLTYGYQQSFRYRPCFKNQEYLDYLKKIVRFAIEEVKTDFIHFDNFDLNSEPDSCHCSWCVNGFRDRLRTKYSAAQRKERFGFVNVDYVNPPEWNQQNPPAKLQIIFDPVLQEWIDFRCQLMGDALRQAASYAKSLNPEVAIEVNPHGITGGNRAWEAGIDHARILGSTQAFWTEEPNLPGVRPDGRLISKIRSYKLARAYNNILLTYIADDELAMAESLAFNQTIGFAGIHPLTAAMRQYIQFYRENREIFRWAEDLAEIAVLRSYPSIAYNHARCQLSAVLAEQALIESRTPFRLIFDEQLADLSRLRVLVLPDSECLSDGQLARIRAFVERGGGLVAIGSAGLYDEWRRRRTVPGLAGLAEGQAPARAYEETVRRAAAEGSEQRKQSGHGRVFYLPALEFDGPLPEFGSNFPVDNRFWKRPANAAQFLDGIRWAIEGGSAVEVAGSGRLVANAVEQPAARRWAVHLVNYGAANGPAGDVRVTCRPPEGARAATVRIYSPGAPAREAPVENRSGAARFAVPPVKVYSIASVQWS